MSRIRHWFAIATITFNRDTYETQLQVSYERAFPYASIRCNDNKMQIDNCVDPTIAIFTLVSITCQQGMEVLIRFFFQQLWNQTSER